MLGKVPLTKSIGIDTIVGFYWSFPNRKRVVAIGVTLLSSPDRSVSIEEVFKKFSHFLMGLTSLGLILSLPPPSLSIR